MLSNCRGSPSDHRCTHFDQGGISSGIAPGPWPTQRQYGPVTLHPASDLNEGTQESTHLFTLARGDTTDHESATISDMPNDFVGESHDARARDIGHHDVEWSIYLFESYAGCLDSFVQLIERRVPDGRCDRLWLQINADRMARAQRNRRQREDSASASNVEYPFTS